MPALSSNARVRQAKAYLTHTTDSDSLTLPCLALACLVCQDLLYPNSGYSSETGGKMKNLRTLTNAQVTKYHGLNYRPENALLLVTGNVEEERFLKVRHQPGPCLPPSRPSNTLCP